jgi:drug/metabolite transporter (DMT)-like permease
MHSLTSFSSQCVIASSLLSLFLPSAPRWTTPTSPMHLLLFLLIGIMGFVAQALMTLGYQRETAGRGSMGIYAQIVFAAFWDRVVFHAEVKLLSVIGTVLILGSALYVAVITFIKLVYFDVTTDP